MPCSILPIVTRVARRLSSYLINIIMLADAMAARPLPQTETPLAVPHPDSSLPVLRVIRPEDDSRTLASAESQAGLRVSSPPHGLEPTAELLAELAEASERLETAHPREILRWGIERFAPHFTMATAFGPEGMCLIHWIAEIDRKTSIFNLDTGYQFTETLELREKTMRRYGIDIQLVRPKTTVEEYEAINGGPVYKDEPDRCCQERKISLLHGAVQGKHGWASAIRRDQTGDRSKVPIVGWDKKFQLVKVSPLANWSKAEVWKTILDHDIPYNPLHDQGYPSIGCWPCTRAVLLGEDERAGRWSGFRKTECGLHTSD